MSKTIKYITCVKVNIGTGENASIKETFIPTSMPYSEANEEIAKREAHKGEYTIEDDGVEEVPAPTELDKLDARLTYMEMMSGMLEV